MADIGCQLLCLGKSNLFGCHSSVLLHLFHAIDKSLYSDQNVVLTNVLLHYVNGLERSFLCLAALTITPSAFYLYWHFLIHCSKYQLETFFTRTSTIVLVHLCDTDWNSIQPLMVNPYHPFAGLSFIYFLSFCP